VLTSPHRSQIGTAADLSPWIRPPASDRSVGGRRSEVGIWVLVVAVMGSPRWVIDTGRRGAGAENNQIPTSMGNPQLVIPFDRLEGVGRVGDGSGSCCGTPGMLVQSMNPEIVLAGSCDIRAAG
jgi:hypothetical protein